MTERLADVSARIDGISQLGAVVNAMKGIAAARVRTAMQEIAAVDSYAETIATAISSVVGANTKHPAEKPVPGQVRTGLLVFLAEQGFAGAFSDRVLDSIGDALKTANLFLIGTRGIAIAATRDVSPVWHAAMPAHTPGIPKLADSIMKAILQAMDEDRFERLDVIHANWASGQPQIGRQTLFPIELPVSGSPEKANPLTQLSMDTLLTSLSGDYIHALICKAALHAFAAENQARMEAMSGAGSQINSELETFEALLRRVRQEEITAEIIELGTGTASARDARNQKHENIDVPA